MRWFTDRFYKEGAGISKDEPKKHGLALLWQIIRREFWELFKLNFFVIIFSLPLITIPAAYAAATAISMKMVEDENVYLWRDFIGNFRRLFWRASLAGFGFAAAITLGIYACYIYAQLILDQIVYIVPLMLSVAVSILITLICAQYYVWLARFDLSIFELLKSSALSILARPIPALAGLFAVLSLWLAHIVFYPISIFMPAIFLFSFGALLMTFALLKNTHFVFGHSTLEGEQRRGADNFANVQKAHKHKRETITCEI